MGYSTKQRADQVGIYSGTAMVHAANAAQEGLSAYRDHVDAGGRAIPELEAVFFSMGVFMMVGPLEGLAKTDIFRTHSFGAALGVLVVGVLATVLWSMMAFLLLERGYIHEGSAFNALISFLAAAAGSHFYSHAHHLYETPLEYGFGMYVIARIVTAILTNFRLYRTLRRWVMGFLIALALLSPWPLVLFRPFIAG